MKNKTVTAQQLIDAGLPKAIFWNNDLSKEVSNDIFIVATLKRSHNDFIIEKFMDFFGEDYLLSALIKHRNKLSNTLFNAVIDQINNSSNFKINIDKDNILFVYGSLKKGFDNHNLLSNAATYMGEAITVNRYAMYQDSFGNYPYLIPTPIMQIHGELYHIKSDDLWRKIDKFEGAPDYYERKKILVNKGNTIYCAWVYIQSHTQIPKNQKPLNKWLA